eukprot:8787030-Pyramimonas_sp.AAC.1
MVARESEGFLTSRATSSRLHQLNAKVTGAPTLTPQYYRPASTVGSRGSDRSPSSEHSCSSRSSLRAGPTCGHITASRPPPDLG